MERCPYCNNILIEPFTGLVTSEQLEIESKACLKMETCDAGCGTTGYHILCKNKEIQNV